MLQSPATRARRLRGDEPHLHAFLEARLAVFRQQPIDVEPGYFARVTNGIVFRTELAKRFDPADGTATRVHSEPEGNHSDAKRRHRYHSGHDNFPAPAVHFKPLNLRNWELRRPLDELLWMPCPKNCPK